MMKQAQGKIIWPRMLADLREKYDNCEEYRKHKPSRAQACNEIFHNMFDSYMPGQRVQKKLRCV